MKSVSFRRAAVAVFLSAGFLAPASASGQLWWERGADEWYYKDDWKAQAISGGRKVGRALALVKKLPVPDGAFSGWIVVWGDRGYKVSVNGKPRGSSIDGCLIDDYDMGAWVLHAKEVTISLEGGGKVCAEGEIVGLDGKRYPFATGEDWTDEAGGKVKAEKMAVRSSRGAYDRAHNGRLMTYNDEERGKTAIAKCLARIQKLNEQGIFLMRRYRPADEVLAFRAELPWRRAEAIAAPLMEKAKAILTTKGVPAQKAGRFTDAIAAADEAAVLISAAEAPVAVTTELYRADREITHLDNVLAILGEQLPPPKEDLSELFPLVVAARDAHRLGDWASVRKSTGRIASLAREVRARMDAAADKAFGGLIGGVGELDEFPEDRFAWLNARELMGNDPVNWPFVVAPSDAAYIDLCGLWDFRTDPDNVGEKENWHSVPLGAGWRKLFAPKPWERQGVCEDNRKAPGAPIGKGVTGEDKPYNGFAWYRKGVFIPRSWRGNKVILRYGNVQNWCRVFLNGKALEQAKGDEEERRLTPASKVEVPGDAIEFGQENLIAIQVYNHDNFGGIVGGTLAIHVEGAQPDVRETPGPLSYAYEYAYPSPNGPGRLSFFAGAMSPGVLVAADSAVLELCGWEARGYELPQGIDWPAAEPDAVHHVTLKADGDLLPAEPVDGTVFLLRGRQKNVLVLLDRRPKSVRWNRTAQGSMSLAIEFPGKPARAAVVPLGPEVNLGAPTRLLAEAVRNYPVSASECVRAVAPGGPGGGADRAFQRCSIRYNYWRLAAGAANARAHAPVPVLAGYARMYTYPGLRLDGARPTPYASQYVAYEVVGNTDTVTYESPAVDRSKVMKGAGELFARKRAEQNVHGGLGEKEMFRRMASWGFDHCRYAVAFDADWDMPLAKPGGGPVVEDEAPWKRLDELIGNCTEAGMQMMLCWFPEIGSRRWKDHPERQANAVEFWRRVAKRYAQLPEWAISYDFFNEPAYMNRDHWNQFMKELTKVVRAEDPRHMIVWESADGWAQPHWCLWMEPVNDRNVLYSFHHYGKHWGYAYDEYYPSYQSTFERTQVDAWLEAILFSIKNHAAIHCGEFGISMIQPGRDGEAWLNDYLGLFERFGIGWNWWNYSGGDIYRTGLAAGDRISPYVPILSKWAARSGWGATRRASGQWPSTGAAQPGTAPGR